MFCCVVLIVCDGLFRHTCCVCAVSCGGVVLTVFVMFCVCAVIVL